MNKIDTMEYLLEHIDDLTTLSYKEKQFLYLRYGLVDGETRTLEQVGKEFGVTRERIRQIEAKAFEELRQLNKQNNETN